VIVEGDRAGFNLINLSRLRLPDDPPGINRAGLWRWLVGG